MTQKMDPKWWLAEEEEAHKKVMAVVRALDSDLESQKLRMVRAARLYDPSVEVLGTHLDLQPGPPGIGDRGPVTMNIIKSAIDTVTSMVAKNQPRAAFMTDGADYTMYTRALDLERFIEAEFQRTEVYDDAVRMFRDAAAMGTGIIKIWAEEGSDQTEIERVMPWDVVIDEAETLAGRVRQIHHIRFVDREVLAHMFPDKADEIAIATVDDTIRRWTRYRQVESEMMPLVESWHLPSGPGADDGRHSICIDGVTLAWEEWDHDYFPFVIFRWSERLTGFYGCSLSEELAGIQNKINKINWHITRCHDLSNSYVIVQAADAKLSVSQGRGKDPLQLLVYNGQQEPKFVTPTAVNKELYEHLIFLIQQAYKIAGISEMSAHSALPKSLESGIAIQNYSDLETQRFSIQSQRYERAILDIARQVVRLMQEIGGNATEAKWKSGNLFRTINWNKVKIDEDRYVMSIEASSVQSRTPSGRLQAAIELGKTQLLEPDELRRMIGHPDLTRALSLANSSVDHAEAICEKLSRGEDVTPEALDNLEIVIKYAAQHFMIMKDRGAPERILDAYRRFIRGAMREINKPSPAGAQAPIPGMVPGGMAAPPEGAMPLPGALPPVAGPPGVPMGPPPGPPVPQP